MNLSEDLLHKVEQYLNGNMTDDSIKSFELQLKNNKELSEYVFLNKQMRNTYNEKDWAFIEDSNNKEIEILEDNFRSTELQSTKKAIQTASEVYVSEVISNKKKTRLYFMVGIAASLILLIGYFSINKGLTNSEIYSSYYSLEDLPSFVSRGNINNDLLLKGEQAFNNKNYKLAEQYFNQLINDNGEISGNMLLYLGLSQLELNKHDASINSFNQLLNSKTIDRSKGYWYKTLVYLKMDDRDNAISELKKIVQDNNNFNYKLARELLIKLK